MLVNKERQLMDTKRDSVLLITGESRDITAKRKKEERKQNASIICFDT